MADDFKKDFPFFSSEKNKGLVYFDNAATTQRPERVLRAMREFYEENNANPLRGLYGLSERATESYNRARSVAARFVNAREDCEMIFTRNATEALNLVAYSYGMAHVGEGDEIVISIMEHHSNLLPWQMVAQAKGAKIVWLECDKSTGQIPRGEIESKITGRAKIVAVAQVGNVLGTLNDIKFIAAKAREKGAVVVVDGAQSVPHMKVDVQDLDADFLAFSGHKLAGPMGCGALYGKKSLLEEMPPFLRGGEMIEYVSRDGASWADLPAKFEAGTVSAADAVGMAAAMEYVSEIGMDKIARIDEALSSMLMDGIKKIPGASVLGGGESSHRGIVSFTLDGVHPHDIASVLDSERIAIRAGHHCAQPLGAYLGVPASARASVYFYNTEEEVDKFLCALKNVRKWMGLE